MSVTDTLVTSTDTINHATNGNQYIHLRSDNISGDASGGYIYWQPGINQFYDYTLRYYNYHLYIIKATSNDTNQTKLYLTISPGFFDNIYLETHFSFPYFFNGTSSLALIHKFYPVYPIGKLRRQGLLAYPFSFQIAQNTNGKAYTCHIVLIGYPDVNLIPQRRITLWPK